MADTLLRWYTSMWASSRGVTSGWRSRSTSTAATMASPRRRTIWSIACSVAPDRRTDTSSTRREETMRAIKPKTRSRQR
jgi:hypothetical protein